jgi:hypothetical protein
MKVGSKMSTHPALNTVHSVSYTFLHTIAWIAEFEHHIFVSESQTYCCLQKAGICYQVSRIHYAVVWERTQPRLWSSHLNAFFEDNHYLLYSDRVHHPAHGVHRHFGLLDGCMQYLVSILDDFSMVSRGTAT